MKHFLLVLGITLLFPIARPSARAAPGPIPLEAERFETAAASPDSDSEWKQTEEWIEEDLAEARSENPAIVPRVFFAGAKPAPPSVWKAASLDRLKAWAEKSNYRLSFAVIRASLNGGLTLWTLMVHSHAAFIPAATVASVVGALMGSEQYWNAAYQNWITHPGWFGKKARRAEEFLRWYSLEALFVAATEMTMVATGAVPPGTASAADLLKASLLTTAAEGAFELAVTEDESQARLRNPARNSLYRFVNDLSVLAVSSISVVFGTIGELQHSRFADGVLLTLAAGGAAYYLKAIAPKGICRRLLGRKPD